MRRKPESGLFVVGTNTEVGKTYVTSLIAANLRRSGVDVGVYKPVASGCVVRDGKLVSTDAEQIWRAAGKPRSLTEVTPQCFQAPLAPNVAARSEGSEVDTELLHRGIEVWSDTEFVLVEGVGGLMSPLSDNELVVHLAVAFGLPLLVVVPNVLGCISQLLLTLSAAKQFGLTSAGVVLNDLQPSLDESSHTNRSEIERLSPVSLVAHLKFGATGIDLSGLSMAEN